MASWLSIFGIYLAVVCPAVWLWLGRFVGSNSRAQARIRGAPLAPAPPSQQDGAGAGAGAGASDSKATEAEAAAAATPSDTQSVVPPVPDAPRLRRRLSILNFDKPSVNPFINATTKLSAYERAKYAITAPTLLPLRIVATLVLYFGALLVVMASTIGMSKHAMATFPMPAWRKALRFPGRIMIHLWFITMGIRLHKTGRLASQAEAPIVVSNHVCFFEPLVLVGTHMFAAISAASNANMPLMGRAMRALQCILVDRTDPNSRTKCMDAIRKYAKPHSGWPQLLIFPEGTTTNTQAVISYKVGAFAPGLPVQPVAVRYPFKHFDISWVPEGPSLGALALRLMCQFTTTMTVDYLPVYKPSSQEVADPKLYARNVQKLVADHLGIPCTEHTYEDVQLAMDAVAGGATSNAGAVELHALRKKLSGVTVHTAKRYLNAFLALSTPKSRLRQLGKSKKDGAEESQEQGSYIDLKAFAKIFGQDVTQELRNLFVALDTDDSGFLDFREFLVGLAILNEQSEKGRVDALRLAFTMFDTGDGKMRQPQLAQVLRRVLPDLSNEDVEALFKEADKDGNGAIDCDEFVEFGQAHADMLPMFRAAFL